MAKNTPVSFGDSPSLDAFSRLRASLPSTQFDSQSQYDLDTEWSWNTYTSGTGSITHLPDQSAAELEVGTDEGDRVVRQTKRYFRYRPGKSQLILITGVLGTATTGVEQSFGYGDDENGIFLKQKADGLYLVLRSKSSGSVVDDEVPQSRWSGDKCDGTGPSLITINPEESLIFGIDLEWLGVGRVRTYLWYNGSPVVLHTWFNAGGDRPYTTTANLPIRYEIKNTAASAGATIKSICSTVISEGGEVVDTGKVFSVGNGTTLRSVSQDTRLALISIRPKLTFNSITNRGLISPAFTEIYASGNNDAYWEVIVNGTLTGTPSWTSAHASSLVEYDVSATSVTGGHVLESGYASSSKGGANSSQINFTQLGLSAFALTTNYAATDSDVLTIAVSGIGGSLSTAGNHTWTEIR